MKKYSIMIALLVLTMALLAGCRRPEAHPSELPSTQGATLMPTTIPTTVPTTVPTTIPATEMPTGETDNSAATGNAETDPNTGASNATGSSRSAMPGFK